MTQQRANLMKCGGMLVIVALAGFPLATVVADDFPIQPNIIFVLADDLGKEWVGCYGAENIGTPNIDRLAETGMKFSNAYSMPQCTPSRVCFMTGQYPFRNGWVNHWDVPRWGVGYFDWDRNPSVARVLQSAGYKTAVAGKWQLNDFRVHPDAMNNHGFDEYCMWTGGETDPADDRHTRISDRRYWDPYIHTRDGSRTHPGEFGPDIFNRFLLEFSSNHREDPFFIYYPMVLPHTPFVTTPHDPKAETKLEKHKAMVRYMDYLLGRLLSHLEQTGLRDRTLIVFTSDNGTTGWITNTMNGRTVKGGKMKTTENGVNAPFIVSWPGHVPAGVESDALVDFSDLLPTFADLAGAQLDDGYEYDGVSVKTALLDPAAPKHREWILAMGSHPGVATEDGIRNVHRFRDRVIRGKRFKLFVGTDGKAEKLVDLSGDSAEQRNLLGFPEFAEEAARLGAVVQQLPEIDQHPSYRRVSDYPVYPQ